jgi:hypothetical protein
MERMCWHGPTHVFPPTLTQEEQCTRAEAAKFQFLASLRRRVAVGDGGLCRSHDICAAVP